MQILMTNLVTTEELILTSNIVQDSSFLKNQARRIVAGLKVAKSVVISNYEFKFITIQ